MRILWLTWKDLKHPLAGGAELVNEEIAQRMVADGHEVQFIVGGFKGGAHRETMNGYSVVRVGNRYTLWWHAFRHYYKHFRGWADIVVEEVNTAPFFTAWYVKEPKVLFFHQLCREIWFHQMPLPFSLIGYMAEPLYLRLLGSGPVITVSESVRSDLMRHGFNGAKISIITEGIKVKPLATLQNQAKYEQPTLLSFGALRAMKRTLDHIEAFDIAKASMPNLRLVIAGASEAGYGDKVIARIAASPYHADIQYIGRPTDQEKQDLFRKSHCLLMTSVKEGWGLVVTEAASQGTPAVVYDVDGLRDSVRHNETGIVTPCNPADLAQGTLLLLQGGRYEDMRRAAWQWSKRLTFTQSYHDFMAVLEQVPRPTAVQQFERGEQ